MYEACHQKIWINGFEFECHCDAGHTGDHVTRVKMDRILYSGFGWSIDENGDVTLNISPGVSHEIMSWEKKESEE